jgi:hypothetical protein
MRLVYYGEYDHETEGYAIREIYSKKLIGIYTGSVGAHGSSTGEFIHCETTNPFHELDLSIVESVGVKN